MGTDQISNLKPIPLGISIDPNCEQYKILDMKENGAAFQTGFQGGDIILAVNGLAISNTDHFHKVNDIWNHTSKGDRIRFSIDRQGVLIEFFVEVAFDGYKFSTISAD